MRPRDLCSEETMSFASEIINAPQEGWDPRVAD